MKTSFSRGASSGEARRRSRPRQAIFCGGRRTAAERAAAPAIVRPSQLVGRHLIPERAVAPAAVMLAQATAEAASIVQAAQTEAEQLLAAARRELATAKESGRSAGYQEGFEQGRKAGQGELRAALELVQSVAQDAKGLRDSILANSEQQIVRLIAAATELVVGQVAEQHPDLVLRGAAQALHRAGDQRILRLRVHPESKAVIEAEYGPTERDWVIRSDKGMALGGCIVDTEAGVIDASIEGQVAEIAQAWAEVA